MLIDSHAHLGSLDDLEIALNNAEDSGVGFIINMSSDYESARQTLEYTQNYSNVFGAVGIHPHQASIYNKSDFALIESILTEDKIVAVGETGLDYFYDNSPRDIQIESLVEHIRLGIKYLKPVVIHMRDSDSDIKRIIGEYGCKELTGVIHCFTGDYDTAMYFIGLGFYISFSGILTFNRSVELREVASKLPEDIILVETDSPYLAPVPYRGKKNQPAFVKYVAEKLAEIRGESFEKITDLTTANAKRLFKLP